MHATGIRRFTSLIVGVHSSSRGAVAVAATLLAVLFLSATPAYADVQGAGIGVNNYQVNGVDGNIAINEGDNVSIFLRFSQVAEITAGGFAGTTTHSINNNVVTHSRSGSSGFASVNTFGGGTVFTQDHFSGGFLTPFRQDGANTVSFSQGMSLHTTENSSYGLGTNNMDWGAGLSFSRNVTVNNVAPTISSVTQNGSGAANLTVNEGTNVALQMQSTDPGDDSQSFFINGVAQGVGAATGGTTRTSTIQNKFYADESNSDTNTFTVFDDDTSTQTTRTVTVLNVAPTITSAPGDETVNPGHDPPPGTLYFFSATAFDPGINDTLTFYWELDGDALFDDYVGSSGSIALGPGPATINMGVRVEDGDGGQDTETWVVTVIPEPSAFVLAALGLIGLLGYGWRRRK